MKRIGLLSDTHGWWDNKYEKYFSDCDEIWHAGDIGSVELIDKLEKIKPVRAVYGNIDGQEIRSMCPEFLRFNLEEIDVLMTHIGGYPGRYDRRVKDIMDIKPPGLFVCGHSHILKVMHDKRYNCLHINPGAAGIYGFHTVRTMVRFTIDRGNIRDLEVIELQEK